MPEETRYTAVRRLLLVLLLGGVLGMMALHVVNPNRGARLEMLEKHHARVRSVNLRLERENQRLASELGELESGLEGWRRVARREYGMVMPGEVVFRFPADERKRRAR